MSKWREILSQQMQKNPPRLSMEDATTIYEDADINELLHAGLISRRNKIPSNKVTYLVDRNINYTNV